MAIFFKKANRCICKSQSVQLPLLLEGKYSLFKSSVQFNFEKSIQLNFCEQKKVVNAINSILELILFSTKINT